MDASINKTRLGHLLSYDWIKILLVAVAAILVWSLVFTMTATRITTTQMYSVVNFYGSYFGNGLNNFSTYANSVFSYEVLESSMVDVQAGGDEYVSTLLETRFVTGEGDVLFVSNTNDPNSKTEKKDENGNVLTDENAVGDKGVALNAALYPVGDILLQLREHLPRVLRALEKGSEVFGS